MKGLRVLGLLVMSSCYTVAAYQLGIDEVTRYRIQKIARRNKPQVGLLTNHTGRDLQGKLTVDLLRSRGITVQRLFVPEHGLHGTIPAAAKVTTTQDKRTGLEVVGLMGSHGVLGTIDPIKLKDIDVLMVDLQDVGMRHFTYSGFLFYFMEVAAQYKKPLIVLDRPNPLGGLVEGPVVKRMEKSLIARAPLPFRHGLTMGELARFYNSSCLANRVALTVIPMKGYERSALIQNSLVAQISPNIFNRSSVYAYSFLGALGEVRPFDIGLGTEHAMQVCALSLQAMPRKKFWFDLATDLKKLGMHTTLCSYWSPRKKTWCRGLKLILKQTPPQGSFSFLLAIINAAHNAGVTLSYAPFFDRAVGDPMVKRYVQGKVRRPELVKRVNKQLARYKECIKGACLYQPLPVIKELL